MSGSTDRKINSRSEILWYAVGALDTSTGDETLNSETNAMNSAAAGLQRSIEGLDQRLIDLGFDPTETDYAHIKQALIGFSRSRQCFAKLYGSAPADLENNSNDNAPGASNIVNRIGLDTSAIKFGMIANGRPIFVTGADVMVTEVDSSGGFSIASGAIAGQLPILGLCSG